MTEENRFLHFLESLWAFLPKGQLRLAHLKPADLAEGQQAQLKLYSSGLTYMTLSLFVLAVHPRAWVLVAVIVAFVFFYRQQKLAKRALIESLGLK